MTRVKEEIVFLVNLHLERIHQKKTEKDVHGASTEAYFWEN